MVLVQKHFGTLNFWELQTHLNTISEGGVSLRDSFVLNAIGICLLIGAMGKSAQIGLHVWLPDAMEGPTPVSALIHAATMVTAGIFLMIRCGHVFILCGSKMMFTISFIGAMTALLGASIALVQNDMKKIIAYSTCSQLGYMMFACGIAKFNLAFYHLANHAFFKALLFLCAGNVIHALGGEQDIRKMGHLAKLMPTTFVFFSIGSLAIMGVPGLSGYYSKDLILEAASEGHIWPGFLVVMYLASALTILYSLKLLIATFWYIPFTKNDTTRSQELSNLNLHGFDNCMYICFSILGFLSIFGGFLTKDIFIGSQKTFGHMY